MKRGLRRSHAVVVVILALVLPLLVAAALRARRAPAVMERLPAALEARTTP